MPMGPFQMIYLSLVSSITWRIETFLTVCQGLDTYPFLLLFFFVCFFFLAFFYFYPGLNWTCKIHLLIILFSFLIKTRPWLWTEIMRSVYILKSHMVTLQYLAQFPVNHLPHPIMFALVFLLRKFAAFIIYVITYFITTTAHSTLDILLRFINISFEIVYYFSVLCIKRESLSPFCKNIQENSTAIFPLNNTCSSSKEDPEV